MSYPPPSPGGPPPYGQPGAYPPQDGFPHPPPPGMPAGQQPVPIRYAYPAAWVPEHPKATTVLILGILSIVVFPPLGPFAWAMGNTALREIQESRGAIGGESNVNAGRVCGIIGSVFLILVVAYIVFIVLLFTSLASSTN